MRVATTERLILRRLDLDDAQSFVELGTDPEVLRYTGAAPMNTLDDARSVLQELQERYARDDFGRWAMIRREDGQFLGWCGLRRLEREGVDLGFWVLRRFWGQGYATEAARASIDLAFERYALPFLLGRAVAENGASRAVLARLGFVDWLKTEADGFDDVRHALLPNPALPVADPEAGLIHSAQGLVARDLQPADQFDFFRLEGNPNVLRYADGELLGYEEAGTAIDRLRRAGSDAELRVFAVTDSEGEFVGTVATVLEGDCTEIGYRILESRWGQGLGRPIARLALAVARALYPRRTVIARCDLRNRASLKVLEALDGVRHPDRDAHAHWTWLPGDP